MAEASIPVDLFNPGQVFACLGFMEVALELEGDATAGFDWSNAKTLFWLRTPGDDNPFERVMEFLQSCSVATIAPEGSANATDGPPWQISTRHVPVAAPFPIPDPESPATLPAVLLSADHTIIVSHWGDGTKRDNVKFWGGSAGKPGAGFLQEALNIVPWDSAFLRSHPFNVSAPQSSSFRFDWRRDYIAIDAGFSLNEHKSSMTSLGFPIVEILAAIGLSHARPRRETKLLYRYGIVGRASRHDPADLVALPPPLLRAALGASVASPFPSRRFVMRLGWPGQENQARCITTVTEEFS